MIEHSNTARVSGHLPGGPEFSASISLDLIALRVGDRVCFAGPQWMTEEQTERATDALAEAERVVGAM